MEIDPSTGDGDLHRTLTTIVAPRPIGWISSRSEAGQVNLAPYSYFNAVCTDPPVVAFSAMDAADGGLKDTPSNVLETGEFVFNLVTEDQLRAADRSGAALPPEGNEFDHAGVETAPGITVDAPGVADALARMECVLNRSARLHDTATVVFGDVQRMYVDERICTDGKVDAREVDAVGRLGGPYYSGVEPLSFERGDGEE